MIFLAEPRRGAARRGASALGLVRLRDLIKRAANRVRCAEPRRCQQVRMDPSPVGEEAWVIACSPKMTF